MCKENQKNLLSVVVLSYNRPKMLPGALKSIKTKSPEKIQVVVVDDGSCSENLENVRAAVSEISRSGANIKLVENVHNKGVAESRNIGLRASDADWILFLDDDDEFTEDYVDYLLALLEQEAFTDQYAGGFCNTFYKNFIDDKTSVLTRNTFSFFTEQQFKEIEISIGIGFGVMLKKEAVLAVGGFDKTLHVSEDTDLFIRLVRSGFKMMHFPTFGIVISRHNQKKLTSDFKYHASHHIYRTLFRRYKAFLKTDRDLYRFYIDWVKNVYKENKMNTAYLLFSMECKI